MNERRPKPARQFTVRVRRAYPVVIEGETFFFARAAYCARNAALNIEPHEVRLWEGEEKTSGR